MASSDTAAVTRCLHALSRGDRSAMEQLVPLVYDALRQQAASYLRREPAGHSLQPTALVHEAFLKLADQKHVSWQGRSHFFAIGAQAMRRILVDHARRKARAKHGGRRRRIALDEHLVVSPQRDEDLLALDEALSKLARVDPRQAQIVELRFFGGLSVQEVAEVLGVSKRTIEADWTAVRAWLRRELSGDGNQ
ncbi:MAG: RNA polymerase subunit sigma-70 [Planctomycetes bacterium RBG_16_64_10]|nr:MAG: RNA polymerase subunit sigma-70 [Planctomycetes bacterium RBG_16_64_10]